MTKTEVVINGLLKVGCMEVTHLHRTKKYRVFQYDANPNNTLYFVGSHAGVRKGKTISNSLSIDTDQLIAYLERLAQKRSVV